MSVPRPNYTQTPNALYDLMPQMKEAELRVTLAIVRETFGWHRETARLSISKLQKLTGLSRQGVINGTESGIERGTIIREKEGDGYLYSLCVNEVDTDSQLVNEVDYPSQRSRLPLVNVVDQQTANFPEVEVPPKESIKETSKEKNVADKQQPPFKAILKAFVDWKEVNQPGCVINYAEATKAAKAVAQQNWTPDQVIQCCNILNTDPFYGSSSLSLWTVGKQIGAKVKRVTDARPPAAQPVLAPDWMTYGIAEENQWIVQH